MGQQVNLTGEILNGKKKSRVDTVSTFTGTCGGYFGMMLTTALLSLIPFCMPFAICRLKRWECAHTKIVGMRLKFEGRAGNLLGRFFVWGFFTIITIGIYGIFIAPVRMKQWEASNTIFDPIN